MSRKIIPFIIAFVLICLVMGVAGVFSFGGSVSAQKFGDSVAWSRPFPGAESMKVIDLTGDGQDELFVQNSSDVAIYDGTGAVMADLPFSSPKTTLGDVDGDGVEDIIVYHVGTGMSVDVISKMQQKNLANLLDIGFPARIALIRFASGPQIILGDNAGSLLALSTDGQPLWELTAGQQRGARHGRCQDQR